jgi:DNA mismatch repair ATPase MutS
MSITVTHYPKLVELSNEVPNNGFRTFHVEIKRDQNGKVIRTFKLKEGATAENIAGDILQEHGIFDAHDLEEVERLENEFGN